MTSRTGEGAPAAAGGGAGAGGPRGGGIRTEAVRRATAILRRSGTCRAGLELAQRIAQANTCELRAAVENLDRETEDALREDPAAPVPAPPTAPPVRVAGEAGPPRETPCPRCARPSRDALLAMSCPWCGHAWAEEGAAQPPGGERVTPEDETEHGEPRGEGR